MIACFFGKTVHVATVPLEHHRTIDSEWYTTICLAKVLTEIRKTNKRRQIIVHHDNARCHTSVHNVQFMGHSPYRPGLAPNDVSLFPHKKKCMVKDSRRQQMLLKRSNTMFWRCLNRSGKSASTSGLSAWLLMNQQLKLKLSANLLFILKLSKLSQMLCSFCFRAIKYVYQAIQKKTYIHAK